MLLLIELIGGLLLGVLLWKKTALRNAATVNESVAAERTRIRLIMGCGIIGLPLGLYLNGGFPDILSVFSERSSITWVYFVGIPLLLIVLALLLARLRKEFVDPNRPALQKLPAHTSHSQTALTPEHRG